MNTNSIKDNTNPPENVWVEVLISDRYGDYWIEAKRVDYRDANASAKWRFVDTEGQALLGKDKPEDWREINE